VDAAKTSPPVREPETEKFLEVRPSPPLPQPARHYGWLSRLRSYLFLDPLIFAYTFVFGLISIPASLFGDRERILHGFARGWSKLIMRTIQSPVKVTGLEKIDTSKAHVYAVNHASALDIPILYAYLPFRFRIMFKSELLSYPIIGWHLKRSGQICINQQEPTKSVGFIKSALRGLGKGIPLVIFPEGGRTTDGNGLPFLPGAFFLAIKAQCDVVPVALVGTFDLLPMNTYHIKCRPLQMRVGDPILTTGMTMNGLPRLSAQVEIAIRNLYYGAASAAVRDNSPASQR
jgi:1-acyl-sn-glycerol-3-phosphate acyltransferase